MASVWYWYGNGIGMVLVWYWHRYVIGMLLLWRRRGVGIEMLVGGLLLRHSSGIGRASEW